jgi:SAM-dependent methyltransferase
VDPVPTIDRPHGAATVTGTRIYSEALLSHLRSSGGPKPRRRASDDQAVTVLANADVAWKDSEVAVIGESPSEVDEWLERRKVARVERFPQPPPDPAAEFDVVAWPSGFERCRPKEIGARLEAAAGMLREGGTLVVRVRILGAEPGGRDNGEPPLAELLFPAAAQASDEVTAWDAPTFSSWLQARGFRVVAERRIERGSIELKALERFGDKLGAFSEEELVTAAVDFTLRRAEDEGPAEQESPVAARSDDMAGGEDAAPPNAALIEGLEVIAPGDDVLEISPSGSDGSTPVEIQDVDLTHAGPEMLADGALEPESADVIICSGTLERVEPERLADACSALYGALRPGGQLLLSLETHGAWSATRATILAGLLRAGFELVATEGSEEQPRFHLLRPLELPDILSFAS